MNSLEECPGITSTSWILQKASMHSISLRIIGPKSKYKTITCTISASLSFTSLMTVTLTFSPQCHDLGECDREDRSSWFDDCYHDHSCRYWSKSVNLNSREWERGRTHARRYATTLCLIGLYCLNWIELYCIVFCLVLTESIYYLLENKCNSKELAKYRNTPCHFYALARTEYLFSSPHDMIMINFLHTYRRCSISKLVKALQPCLCLSQNLLQNTL